MGYEVLIGDCIESMKKLPDESVDMCVTSPPYWGLRDYGGSGKVWGGDPSCDHDWEGYTRPSENTRNNDNSLQLKSAYWEPQDQAFCKHCDAWFGQLGLEPTPQQFVKNMVEVFEEVRRILKPHGTLWVNLGDSYCGTGHKGTDMKDKKHPEGRNGQVVAVNNKIEGLKRKDLVGIPWRVAFALQEAGWYLRQDIIWAKPNCMPEPVKDRCTKSHEYLFLLSKKDSYFFDHEAIKEDSVDHEKTAARYTQPFGGIKNETLLETDQVHIRPIGMREFSGKRNKRSVWTVNPKPFREAHFAVYPPELIEPCILAGCPHGGVVLDPFGGSGTTAGVAIKHGRNAILCELNEEYAALIPKRVESISQIQKETLNDEREWL
jgi:DNA modification methylase